MNKARTTKAEQNGSDKGVVYVTIKIPVAVGRDFGYQSQILQQDITHIRSLTQDHRRAMQMIYAGMRVANVETEDGKPVATQQDAIRTLLQFIYDAGMAEGMEPSR